MGLSLRLHRLFPFRRNLYCISCIFPLYCRKKKRRPKEKVRHKMEISKSDWKLYREKIADWQENYMDRLNKEYIALLSSYKGNPSDRFWKLEERIRRDKKHPGVTIEMRKSSAFFDIAALISLKVITIDDLADFSDTLKEAVKIILDR